MSDELYGQLREIPNAEGGDRPKQRAWVVRIAEETTVSRMAHQEFRPIGIPYLAWASELRLKQYPHLWPNIPSEEGLRRRIQETADARFFAPSPLIPIGRGFDIDPRASASVFGGTISRQTSCYLLNPIWLMEQSEWDRFEVAEHFAFKVLKVESLTEMKEKLEPKPLV